MNKETEAHREKVMYPSPQSLQIGTAPELSLDVPVLLRHASGYSAHLLLRVP